MKKISTAAAKQTSSFADQKLRLRMYHDRDCARVAAGRINDMRFVARCLVRITFSVDLYLNSLFLIPCAAAQVKAAVLIR